MMKPIKCFDAHFHIIDNKYPLIANNGYIPNAFTINDYKKSLSNFPLQLCGGAIVSGSFQGYNTDYIIEALNILGKQYVGVINLPLNISDEEILFLHKKQIRAARFNLYRGNNISIKNIISIAKRIYDLTKWHIELYADLESIKNLYNILTSLPKVTIDHLGLFDNNTDLLLKLAEKGVYIKATRFSKLNYKLIPSLMREIYNINPNSLIFGTDLPGTRAPRQFNNSDLILFANNFNEKELHNIMYSNAKNLYLLKY